MEKINKITLNWLISLFIFLFYVSFGSIEPLFGAKSVDIKPKSKKGVEAPPIPGEIFSSPVEKVEKKSKLNPQAGLHFGPLLPVGDISLILDVGIVSGNIFGSIFLPFKFLSKISLQIRSGLSVGFSSINSQSPLTSKKIAPSAKKDTVVYSLIPILQINQISIRIKKVEKIGLRPFLILSGGTTMSTAKIETHDKKLIETSNFDGLFVAGLGCGYRNKAIKNVEFLLETAYYMHFEKISGNFIDFSLGAGYLF